MAHLQIIKDMTLIRQIGGMKLMDKGKRLLGNREASYISSLFVSQAGWEYKTPYRSQYQCIHVVFNFNLYIYIYIKYDFSIICEV